MIKNIPQRLGEEAVDKLVARLKRGDIQARDELIDSHIGLAVYIAGNYSDKAPELREDIYSAALSCVVEKTERIRVGLALKENNNIGAYLNASIVRAIHNLFERESNRAKKHEAVASSFKGKEERPAVYNEAPYNLVIDEIMSSQSFTDDEKVVIKLSIEGYSPKEIAEQLETTTNRVRLMQASLKEDLMEYI